MRPPKLRAWNLELKMMIESEEIFTKENIYMLLNTSDDYVWMRGVERNDKDGKEIYEGDLIKSPSTYLLEVIWSDQKMGFYVKWKNEDKFSDAARLESLEYEWGEVKVWGNIYQNPELMREQE